MAKIPRRFVADAEHAFDLIRGDALLRLANDVGYVKPCREGQMRIMEHRSRRYRELIAAIVAVKRAALVYARNLVRITLGAGNILRPAEIF